MNQTYRLFACVLLALVLARAPAQGQPDFASAASNVRDLVTLHRDMPMDQALRVIRVISGQIVVDTQHLSNPIGLNIDREPWRRALSLIAHRNGLEVWQRESYYELLPASSEQHRPAMNPDPVTIDSREVLISAVFFQADRRAIRALGVDWTTLSGGRVDLQASQTASSLVSKDIFSLAASVEYGSLSVETLFRTFEEHNIGEVVASPQVKVQSGNQGYMQVGADFSVVTADFAGNAIHQFFSTGTILTVTPTIRTHEDMDFVDLVVEAERSALVDASRNLVSKTVARTSAILMHGEQTAIGGLYGQETVHNRTGIPLLKSLPGWFFGLRYLFGYESKAVNKTELVVLIKVEIVPSVRQRQDGAEETTFPVPNFRRNIERIDGILKGLGSQPK